jgi:NAD(P)-dependent dehydrogenase (short-subunit alcohol dehydrogenase family)
MRLEDRIAIVTGASKGIGKGIAEGFAQEGAHLVITGLTDMKGLDDTYNKVISFGRKALKLQIDVSRLDNINKMIDSTIKNFGRVDILVNNAAVFFFKRIVDLTEEEWDQTAATNLKGPYFAVQRLIPEMKKLGKGKIINITSISAFGGQREMFSCYATTKAGIVQMTKSMAIELAPYHINVNAIAPGPIDTPMNQPIFSDPKIINWYMERLPSRRFGKVEDIAHAAVFLASEESDYVHGTTLIVDGGWRSQ